MVPLSLALTLLLTLAPLASATTLLDVGVGPDGFAQPGDPAYVRITVWFPPEAPNESSAPADDCAYADRPVGTQAATRIVDDLLGSIDTPPTQAVLDQGVPKCVATPDHVCADTECTPYASYSLPTGRYYGETISPDVKLTGTISAGIRLDCEDCPWPPPLRQTLICLSRDGSPPLIP